MRKPDPRSNAPRRSDNEKRRLAVAPLANADLAMLAARVSYEGYAKHKLSPRAFGLKPVPAISDDATYCDGHAGLEPSDMSRLPMLLRRGILAGLIGQHGSPDNPRMIWTVDRTGWVFEARVTHPNRAVYHGYPLLPGDAMAAQVISRFER